MATGTLQDGLAQRYGGVRIGPFSAGRSGERKSVGGKVIAYRVHAHRATGSAGELGGYRQVFPP